MSGETPYVREPGYALRYRDLRFATKTGPYTHRREVRAIAALLRRAAAGPGRWLDVPSGAGRLSGLLPGRVCQVDRDVEMLRACPPGHPQVRASALALPFADRSFDGVLCMRLMQHLPSSAERVACLRELARVSRGPVLVSFFDTFSLPHLRRVVRTRLGRRRSGRRALPAPRFRAELEQAGLRAVARASPGGFFSEQRIVLCLLAADGPAGASSPTR